MLLSVGLGCLRLAVHPAACGRQSSEVPYRQQKRKEEMGQNRKQNKADKKTNPKQGEKEVRKKRKRK